ncbi:uncharacterized protein [Prorops nasuta]|uniref:uncharacterized protein isoform X2 n=1 Tax=Prorops nasuta TaxID=863751 RepID=UPI0034CF9B5E
MMVLALNDEWLRLKVLEVQPSLVKLGATVDEATELLSAHDEVLLRLQSKQSPVEELLRQADQLISTQRPRAEVYAAMAETLGQAWRDVNTLLERRKQILDANVLFQCRTHECRESMKALEMACNDTLLPIEIEAVKNFLTKIHNLRKNMLEALMGALKEGKTLLERLKEVSSANITDSEPEKIKIEAYNAIMQVEKWLEDLHDRRRLIEISFKNRKTQLEQCLALALLATDLRDLEEILNDRIAALASSCDQLGDSSSSAELLLFELKKLQIDAKEFQDRSIKITKSTEKLVSSGHFAGEQATDQAYAILGAAADYVNDLDQYEALLNRAIAFFDLARSAITKLDQLEIQLMTTEHPVYSTKLARLHSQIANAIEDVTSKPLTEGYALLNITGREVPGAKGVKRSVEELENYKIRLMQHCTAHEKENLQVSQTITSFLKRREELQNWLLSIAEAFLRGHQDMGSDLSMAEDFCGLHHQLLTDLEEKTHEVDTLGFEILPINERLDESQKSDIDANIMELQNSWKKCKNLVAVRIKLGASYAEFHESAENLDKEIDLIQKELKDVTLLSENHVQQLELKWKTLQPLYTKLTKYGKKFLDEASMVDDPYLDVPRACLCVQSLLEKFANKQITVTESYEKWQTATHILKQRIEEHERRVKESTRTLEWVSKFREQLYPVITSLTYKVSDILQDLQTSKFRIVPELNKAVAELDVRIKSIETYFEKDDVQIHEEISSRLTDTYKNLRQTAENYGDLIELLISIFNSLDDIEQRISHTKILADHLKSYKTISELDNAWVEIDSSAIFISDNLKRVQSKIERCIAKIELEEPPEAAALDIQKLKHIFENIKSNWQAFWKKTESKVEEYKRECSFDEDLERIESDLGDLNEQLKNVDGKFGENLQMAKSASSAFNQFENTIKVLDQRIETFIRTTEETTAPWTPKIQNDVNALKTRWETLKKRAENTRKRIDLCIKYFVLLEEAKDWYRKGNKLLIVLTRKASGVKSPQEAAELLKEIDSYLKPGEDVQEQRIEKIRGLSTIVFGTDRLPQFQEVVAENRQMLDSFAVVSSELRTLIDNLKDIEDFREKFRMEKEEADEKLHAIKAEALAAEVARAEAESARRIAEKLAAETLEKATIHAQRIQEERLEKQKPLVLPSTSVSAQTDTIETTHEEIVEETEITKKEIHIFQKTQIEKTDVIQREPSPLKAVNLEDEKEEVFESINLEKEGFAPKFTFPLNDLIVQEGDSVTLICRLIGSPTPEVIWYKDGVSMLNNPDYVTKFVGDTCTLEIEETFTEDSAKFTCKAFNIYGSVETTATLTVKETASEEQLSPPEFLKELLPSTVLSGNPHQFECKVRGNPLPTVEWYKNEISIDNCPDYFTTYNNGVALLKFEQVLLEDSAIYTCKAINRLGEKSTSVPLIVKAFEIPKEKPYFLTPLSNVVVTTRGRLTLTCEAKGNPMPEFSWLHNGNSIKQSNEIKVETIDGQSSLIIPQTFPKFAGFYSVIATNEMGEALTSCSVTVQGRASEEISDSELVCSEELIEQIPSKIQLPLKDLVVKEGSAARLDCIIIGQPEPEVIWYHDEKPVKESADFQLLFQGDKCSLVIHEAFLDDAGVYKVVAINSGGEASSQCIVSVTSTSEEKRSDEAVAALSPEFVALPTDLLVAQGDNAKFECVVIGEPKPQVRWFSDAGEILPNDRILIHQDVDGASYLKILSTVPEDKGNYVVKASNLHGEAKAFAKLTVKSLGIFETEFIQMEEKQIPPEFKTSFDDRIVKGGVSTKFECIVTGKPTPKCQWLFNGEPVHGNDFLVSTSGDWQVLTIPETSAVHAGVISCVAENPIGKAVCSARLGVDSEPQLSEVTQIEKSFELDGYPTEDMQASSSSEKHYSSEKKVGEGGSIGELTTKMSSTITQSSSTCTKKEFVSSVTSSSLSKTGHEPTSVCLKSIIQSSEQSSSENGAPPVVQSHKVEEYEKIIQEKPGEFHQEKTVVVVQGEDGKKQDVKAQIQKPCKRVTAPRFVSPLTGMIVDQGSNVVLEGIIDGHPSPTIVWTKNDQELKQKTGLKTSYAYNHVRLEISNVNVNDTGRYTCTASSEAGTASSTADLIVKKTIFPPVFGKRLQAQVIKRGDRAIMEVEVTGTPEPTVTWFKDDIPIKEQPPELRIKQQGNYYMLIIEKSAKTHAGKYMVRATNTGGEAMSIADFAVFEPTPDTMTEVHKTVIYENTQDKRFVKPEPPKVEIPTVKPAIQQVITAPPTSTFKIPSIPASSHSVSRTTEIIDTPELKSSKSETISSTIESHQTETKSEQKFHMKLQHQTPPISEPKSALKDRYFLDEVSRKEEVKVKEIPAKFEEKIDNENVETSTIAKKDALSFFESMTREPEPTPSKGPPKEMIKLVEDSQGHEVKVGKLTENYERSSTFQETKKLERKSQDFQTTKKSVQDIFTRLEQGPSPRGVDNKLFEFLTHDDYRVPPADTQRKYEDVKSSFSKSEIHFDTTDLGFNLVPEPPPEISYMPKVEEVKKKRPDVSIKARQLQESFERNLSPIDAPIGGVKIFPTVSPKSEEKLPEPKSSPAFTLPPPPFELKKEEHVGYVKSNFQEKKEFSEKKEFMEEKNFQVSKFSSSTPAPVFKPVSFPMGETKREFVEKKEFLKDEQLFEAPKFTPSPPTPTFPATTFKTVSPPSYGFKKEVFEKKEIVKDEKLHEVPKFTPSASAIPVPTFKTVSSPLVETKREVFEKKEFVKDEKLFDVPKFTPASTLTSTTFKSVSSPSYETKRDVLEKKEFVKDEKIFDVPKFVPSAPTISSTFKSVSSPTVETKREVFEKKEFERSEKKFEPPKVTPAPAFRPASPPRPWSASSDFETKSHISTDLSEYRCHSEASSHQEIYRSSSPKPSADALAMEKSWAKKTSESARKSWPPQTESVLSSHKEEFKVPGGDNYKSESKEFSSQVEQIPGGIKKTSVETSSSVEKRSWSNKDDLTTKEIKKEFKETAPTIIPSPRPIIYDAKTIKVDHTVNALQEKSTIEKYISECEVKKTESTEKTIEEFGSKKVWTGVDDLKAPSLVKKVEPPKKSIENWPCLREQLATPEPVIHLEPGPPPEIGFAPSPVVKEKKIERFEKSVEMSLDSQPAKIPPVVTRTTPLPVTPKKREDLYIPPPALPPKDVRLTPPPLPVKTLPPLEPFPFQPSPVISKPSTKLPPPPMPTKFVKGCFSQESDYESDFDGRFKSKWRPYESDSEEPRYRKVKAPVAKQPTRPKSTEPEPPPPSSFDIPPAEYIIPARPVSYTEDYQQKGNKKTVMKRHERDWKQQQRFQQQQPIPVSPITLKPGSPPIYVQPVIKPAPPKSPPTKKPESPKFKVKIFQQESGYMADTDEPLQQKASSVSIQKSSGKQDGSFTSMTSHMESHSSYSESKSEYFEKKSYESQQEKKAQSFTQSSFIPTEPPKQQFNQQRSSFVEKSFASKSKPMKDTKITQPSLSPSQFVKGEFRESDYESDYETRIPPLWKPSGSESDDHTFRPVKPSVPGPGKPKDSTSRASTFVDGTSLESSRASEIRKEVVQEKPRPKSVLLPGAPAEIAYAPPPDPKFYESQTGIPFHHGAIGTETKKTLKMDEFTDTSRRIVTVEHTSRMIKLGDGHQSTKFDAFETPGPKVHPQHFRVPTPKKFVQGQFKESDYDSDADYGRIRPKWVPVADSDTEDPHYRRVQPPKPRATGASNAPIRHEHVISPMEFDRSPPVLKKDTFVKEFIRNDANSERCVSEVKQQRQISFPDKTIRPGSPPEFGYVSRSEVGKTATQIASRHMSDMTSTFKQKTQKFATDIQTDLKQGKPILKHSSDSRLGATDEPRTYREESRVAEHGTKHIDPDTGLIYFKYDFGYEFGIIFPGEGTKTTSSGSKTIQGQRRNSDIEVPVTHEFTRAENGYSKKSGSSSLGRPNKTGNRSKTVKWEPTSESEFSEAEDARNARKRYSTGSTFSNFHPPSIVIPYSPSPSKWDHTTPSPLYLSPTLQSLSPHYSSAGPPSNVESADSPWPVTNGMSSDKEVVKPYIELLPKRAPMFITPLRDIAVVSGQSAKFECIVQAEPQPNILWSKDGRIIENSPNHEIYYRNGVCRLTINQSHPGNAGTYSCTATNGLGSTETSSTLQVPGNRRSIYGPY